MNQKKIGAFLRELRMEKKLTQEQLAEQLNVSGRTVSRWETGNNMPDISILIEIAEFYGIGIQEIINGERESEKKVKEELRDTLEKVGDYSDLEKDRFLNKLRRNAIGAAVVLFGVLAAVYGSAHDIGGVYLQWMQAIGIGVAIILTLKSILYVSRLKDQMGKNRDKKIKQWNIAIIAIIISVVIMLFLIGGIIKLFDLQYNLKTGISNYVGVTYDASREMEWVGKSEHYQVYVDGLKLEDCYLIKMDASTMTLTEAVQEGWITVDDLTRKAWNVYQNDNGTVYAFENYEIVVEGDTCIIRPLSK